MQIRSLRVDDAADVAALWIAGAKESAAVASCFQPRMSPGEYAGKIATELADGHCIGWGAFTGEPPRLAAYLTARTTTSDPEFVQERFLCLLDLDVSRQARRQGLASRLVEAAKAFARSEGLARIEVNWLFGDARASSFWQSQGFDPFIARGACRVAPGD